jgi:hypothetical protein
MKKPASKKNDFDDWAAKTRRAYKDAKAKETAPRGKTPQRLRPAETAEGILQVNCYRYYHLLDSKGQLPDLAKHLARQKGGRWIRHEGDDIDNVLRLLEEPGSEWFITPSRRARIANRLRLAARYDIHLKLLLGFLYEAGADQDVEQALDAVSSSGSVSFEWAENYKRISEDIRDGTKRRKRKASEKEA